MGNLVPPNPSKLASLYAMLGSHWQPIDTAPTDGTVVMLWARELGFKAEPRNVIFGYYRGDPGSLRWKDELSTGWEAAGGFQYGFSNLVPTHWMPLPPAPEGS